MEKLRVSSMGHRKKLLKMIGALSATQASSANDPRAQGQSVSRDSFNTELERRQLTVMFCDLVGSTALSQELDPEQLREVMGVYQEICRQVIRKYEVHVAQYLGDGVMVCFSWPRAHEDDAERAVRASLEIVDAIRSASAPGPLQVRIGIETGTVVVGETGKGDASVPKVAIGETPNLAARLQGVADPDEIVIGRATRQNSEQYVGRISAT